MRVVEGSREGKAIICIYHNLGGGRGEAGHASALFVLLALTPLSPHSFYWPHFPSPPSPFGGGGGGINCQEQPATEGEKSGGRRGEKKRKISFPSFLPFGKSLFLRGRVGKDGVCKGGGGGGGKDAEIHFSATTTFPRPKKPPFPPHLRCGLEGGREGSRLWQKRDRGTPDSLREM